MAQQDHYGQWPLVACALLGFTTLCIQTILLRELFSVLYGSDLAFAFALASWTSLTALGAVAGGWLAQGASVRRICFGFTGYLVVSLVVFLLVRGWGARDVLPFHAYGFVPLFLVIPCFLGGMLFPWLLAHRARIAPTRAYAMEVTGGLLGGVYCALFFYVGGTATPLLVGIVLALGAFFVGWMLRLSGRSATVMVCLALAIPFFPWGGCLECLTLSVHYRDGIVVDARSTPYGAMAAVRDEEGRATVFENGVPWPNAAVTPSKEAVIAACLALPEENQRTVLVHALRAGFGSVLAEHPVPARLRFVEIDRQALAFAAEYLPGVMPDNSVPLTFGLKAAVPQSADPDLIVIFSGPPSGLQTNRVLTVDFLQRLKARADETILVVALPVAPGFTHPRQEQYLSSVEAAVAQACGSVQTCRTDVGWQFFIGSKRAVDLAEAGSRVSQALPGRRVDVYAQAVQILTASGRLSIDDLALGAERNVPAEPPDAVPVNSLASPAAYFRYLRFRGYLVDEAPGWWSWLFAPHTPWAAILVLGVLLVCASIVPHLRRRQTVFWGSWAATLTLIFGIYLFQSVAGQVYWALSLLSASVMAGILLGTRLRSGRGTRAHRIVVLLIPALLFPLMPLWQVLPYPLLLASLTAAVFAAGSGLGISFNIAATEADRRSRVGSALFALDLLGGTGGLFVAGALFVWWIGFPWTGALSAVAAVVGVAIAELS